MEVPGYDLPTILMVCFIPGGTISTVSQLYKCISKFWYLYQNGVLIQVHIKR
jgi:hypothetical protein